MSQRGVGGAQLGQRLCGGDRRRRRPRRGLHQPLLVIGALRVPLGARVARFIPQPGHHLVQGVNVALRRARRFLPPPPGSRRLLRFTQQLPSMHALAGARLLRHPPQVRVHLTQPGLVVLRVRGAPPGLRHKLPAHRLEVPFNDGRLLAGQGEQGGQLGAPRVGAGELSGAGRRRVRFTRAGGPQGGDFARLLLHRPEQPRFHRFRVTQRRVARGQLHVRLVEREQRRGFGAACFRRLVPRAQQVGPGRLEVGEHGPLQCAGVGELPHHHPVRRLQRRVPVRGGGGRVPRRPLQRRHLTRQRVRGGGQSRALLPQGGNVLLRLHRQPLQRLQLPLQRRLLRLRRFQLLRVPPRRVHRGAQFAPQL